MATYKNFNYFSGIVVLPRLLTKANEQKCFRSRICKDTTKEIIHLSTLQPSRTLFYDYLAKVDSEWIFNVCYELDVPFIAYSNIVKLAMFDYTTYDFISHTFTKAERKLIKLMFDIVYDARHNAPSRIMLKHLISEIKRNRRNIRFFYFTTN